MKTILITGASSGFGLECARAFARDNTNRLVLCARRLERLKAISEELGPNRVHIAVLDVQKKDDVDQFINTIPAPFQDIDVLINNAGLALGLDSAFEAKIDDWEQMIDTNIKGLLYLTRSVLPGMIARKRGHVVNLGSVAGEYAYPNGNVYGATKAFVDMFSKNLRCDLLGTPIRVTNIEPGLAETEFSLVRFKGNAERAKKTYADKKALSAKDIADIVFWATSVPEHVNINSIEVMPVCQAWAGFKVVSETEISR
jgi:3-hydroxy acid dehydrogenase/malonic semialdehyde reductase